MIPERLVSRSLPLFILLGIAATGLADEAASRVRVLQDHAGSVMSLSFSPDGTRLATSSRDGTIKIWDVAAGTIDRTLRGHSSDVYCVTHSPDGSLLASGSGDKNIRLWDARTYKVLRTFEGHTDVVRWVTFSPDGKTLASAGADRTIRLWDVATGKETRSLSGHTGIVKMVVYSPDGKTLVTTGTDATVRTWDVESGKQTTVLEGHTSSIEGIAVSPDGAYYASNSNDATIRIWDARTAQPIYILLGHVGEVDSATFTPDSRTLISGSKDKTIRFWDTQTWHHLHTLTGHQGRIESMQLSADGKILATGGGGGDTSVRLWEMPTLDDAMRAATSATRPAVAREMPSTRRNGAAAARADEPPAPGLHAADVDQLWRLLGNDDGDDVGVAMARLVSLGDDAVTALASRLGPPAEPPTIDRVKLLIDRLQSDDSRVREQATCDLIQAGSVIEEPVREALKTPPSAVVRHRLEMALRDVTTREPGAKLSAAQNQREANSVKALHDIGTPAAIEQLVKLSSGDPESELTRQAKLAVPRK